MSQTDKLLDSLTNNDIETYLADASTEEHIIITDEREVIVPDSLKRIAVQHDHNIETVTFDCPRYWDEHDMSKMAVYINYACPGGAVGSCICTNVRVDEFDSTIMHFEWTISENVTFEEGFIAFLVCVKNADTNGVLRNHWNSQLCKTMYVSEGLELPEDYIQANPDILTQILLFHSDVLNLNKITLERASVYVGTGDMPEWANVQINPEGDNNLGASGVGIKDIRLKEEGENEDIYEIVLDNETTYIFTVKHGISPSIKLSYIEGNPLGNQRNGVVITIVDADGEERTATIYDGRDGRDGTSVSITGIEESIYTDTGVGSTTIIFSDGHRLTVSDGRPGEAGITPHIGENGNWFIGSTDTGVPSTEISDLETAASAESVVNRTRTVQPMVTFVDDDGRAAVWTKLKPLSEQYGLPFVAAMVTDRIGQDNSLTAEQLVALQDMGWEISSHTMGHVHLGNLTDAEQEEQMRGSKEALEAIGIKCDSICYPFSSTNDSTWKIARKYYRCGRQTNWKEWLNESPLETWDLCVTPLGSYYETQTESGLDTSTFEYYKRMVDKAVSGNSWLIFMTHCAETDDTQMGYLAQVIEYVQSLGIPIVTLCEGLDRRGNIVDNGRYDRRNPEDEHFVIGCDCTVEKSAPDKYAVNLLSNAVTNATPPSWFPWNTVSTCRITGTTAGFPHQNVYYGGTLVTNTMGSANMSDIGYKDYTDGRTWQEFYIPKSTGVFRRYALDADTWSEWSYGGDVVLAQDSRTIDDTVLQFPIGTKSKVWITQDGTTAKRPDGINGWLMTDRTDVNGRLFWQTWIPQTKDNPKGNVYFRRWTGTAWDDWTCLGERTGSTNMLGWSTTPKYVGACVFNTTLGKPVWWNGTAWVDATGTPV